MPTRKQRKRTQKGRRHEYETVWIDSEGNEHDEPPDDFVETAPGAKRADGKKPQSKQPQKGSSRATRAPLPPSWRRALKRSFLIAAALMVFMYISNSKATGASRIIGAVAIGGLYGLIFTPLMYYLDQFAYRRWERKAAGQPKKR